MRFKKKDCPCSGSLEKLPDPFVFFLRDIFSGGISDGQVPCSENGT